MSASIKPKCPHCGSYFISSLDGEGKKKCIDCKSEFATVKLSNGGISQAVK